MSRSIWHAMIRGFKLRCPVCGTGQIMAGYVKVAPRCGHCGEDFSHHRADDAPPYFTIMIVGHTVIPLLLLTEIMWSPPAWVHFVLWIPLIALFTLGLLPRVKGAIVGLQWAARMHGFGDGGEGPSQP